MGRDYDDDAYEAYAEEMAMEAFRDEIIADFQSHRLAFTG